jgi:hypothetical protein
MSAPRPPDRDNALYSIGLMFSDRLKTGQNGHDLEISLTAIYDILRKLYGAPNQRYILRFDQKGQPIVPQKKNPLPEWERVFLFFREQLACP